jgi:hypothetical protein
MTLRISLDGKFDATASSDLRELSAKLIENGVAVTTSTLVVPGVKVDLVIGLAIASLTVSSISTLIAAVNFWRGQKAASYRVMLDTGSGASPFDQTATAALKAAIEAQTPISILIEKA